MQVNVKHDVIFNLTRLFYKNVFSLDLGTCVTVIK